MDRTHPIAAVRYLLIIAVYLPLTVFAGCGRAATNADVVGTYHGSYFDLDIVLELRRDGTFQERFTDREGVTHHSSGTWRAESIEGSVGVVLDEAIIFTGFTPPRRTEWRMKVARGIRGGITMYAAKGDPDGFIRLKKE